MPLLKVRVINPNQIVFEGEADHVMAPGTKGMLGILPGHTPFFAEVVKGQLIITKDKKDQSFDIEAGFIKVRADDVTVLIGL
jgi:F-type H+-transporting ATPase subunit epsilon